MTSKILRNYTPDYASNVDTYSWSTSHGGKIGDHATCGRCWGGFAISEDDSEVPIRGVKDPVPQLRRNRSRLVETLTQEPIRDIPNGVVPLSILFYYGSRSIWIMCEVVSLISEL